MNSQIPQICTKDSITNVANGMNGTNKGFF